MTEHESQTSGGSAVTEPDLTSAEPETGGRFDQIVGRYQSALLRYAIRLVGTSGDHAQDIVQEAFMRLHRQQNKPNAESIANLQSWLYRVTHNLAMDERRKRQRRAKRQELGGDQLQDNPPPDERATDSLNDMVQHEAGQHALDELKRLPEEVQHLVTLRVMHGLTLREIRDVTGTPLATVNYRLNEGLRVLSSRLKEAGVV